MIVPNVDVLVFFRELLLEGLELQEENALVTSKTKVLYENKTPEKNYKGIFLQEFFSPVREQAVDNCNAGGFGFYRIIVWDDKNTGYRPNQASDIVANFFQTGTYEIEGKTYKICIDYKEVDSMQSDPQTDKVYIPITVYYRKFEN